MPKARKPSTSRGRDKHVIGVVVVPDSVPLEVVVTQSVFGPPVPSIAELMDIPEDSPYEVVLCAEHPRQLLARGIDMGELAPLDVLGDADTVLVPGIADPLADRGEGLLEHLRTAHSRGARMVSLCGGAFILAAAGVLDGRRATTHWMLAPEFRARYPHVYLDVDKLYVDDPPVHTSGGIFAATDLALHLVALDRGQAVANDLSRILVSAPHRSGGQQQFIKEAMRAEAPSSLQSLQQWLREHLDDPLTLESVARREHMSERTLVRRFHAETGMSLLEWINRERVNRSKVLLETTDFAVSEIAAMVGFGSNETLRRNFDKWVGTTASAYRRSFREAS